MRVSFLSEWLWCKLGVKSIRFSCDLLNQKHIVSVTVRGGFEPFLKSRAAFHKYLSCFSFLRYSLNVNCSVCFGFFAILLYHITLSHVLYKSMALHHAVVII